VIGRPAGPGSRRLRVAEDAPDTGMPDFQGQDGKVDLSGLCEGPGPVPRQPDVRQWRHQDDTGPYPAAPFRFCGV